MKDEMGEKAYGKNKLPSKQYQIVLYRVEQEMAGAGSIGADIADLDSLIDRCEDSGMKAYIGTFTEISFMSKIKEFLD